MKMVTKRTLVEKSPTIGLKDSSSDVLFKSAATKGCVAAKQFKCSNGAATENQVSEY
jgi:hypothetical protein